jgi:short-subunit dehydrogenase
VDLRAVEERIVQDPPLDLLVNNAGAIWPQAFVDSDPDGLEAFLYLHSVAVMRLTRAALPAMIARGSGTIITVSTAAIFFPQPDYYSATKTFGEAFMRALFEEVRGTGVRLQALCPGYTRTEIFERAGVTAEEEELPASAWMTAEDVVRASLAGLELGEIVCLPSVEDARLLDRIREHQQVLIDDAEIGTLAQRYATHGS